jgi:hypothetical protein
MVDTGFPTRPDMSWPSYTIVPAIHVFDLRSYVVDARHKAAQGRA